MTNAEEPDARAAERNNDQSPRRQRESDGECQPRPSRLKLKSDRSHKSSSRASRRHRRRRHRRSRSPIPEHNDAQLDPEAAFRESLFDAMADDEGASYWESVYGQPIHVYSNERVGPQGQLEQMTDDQYAAHVRQKMWEKTHAGLLEERARREERRKQEDEEERRARRLQRDMEHSLRQGEERRQRRRLAAQWEAYGRAWSMWDGTLEKLAWPVDDNDRRAIDEKNVRAFYSRARELESRDAWSKILKEERVRWHPDKMQQKLGGKVDHQVMKDVTAVFQIVDKVWSETRCEG